MTMAIKEAMNKEEGFEDEIGSVEVVEELFEDLESINE